MKNPLCSQRLGSTCIHPHVVLCVYSLAHMFMWLLQIILQNLTRLKCQQLSRHSIYGLCTIQTCCTEGWNGRHLSSLACTFSRNFSFSMSSVSRARISISFRTSLVSSLECPRSTTFGSSSSCSVRATIACRTCAAVSPIIRVWAAQLSRRYAIVDYLPYITQVLVLCPLFLPCRILAVDISLLHFGLQMSSLSQM